MYFGSYRSAIITRKNKLFNLKLANKLSKLVLSGTGSSSSAYDERFFFFFSNPDTIIPFIPKDFIFLTRHDSVNTGFAFFLNTIRVSRMFLTEHYNKYLSMEEKNFDFFTEYKNYFFGFLTPDDANKLSLTFNSFKNYFIFSNFINNRNLTFKLSTSSDLCQDMLYIKRIFCDMFFKETYYPKDFEIFFNYNKLIFNVRLFLQSNEVNHIKNENCSIFLIDSYSKSIDYALRPTQIISSKWAEIESKNKNIVREYLIKVLKEKERLVSNKKISKDDKKILSAEIDCIRSIINTPFSEYIDFKEMSYEDNIYLNLEPSIFFYSHNVESLKEELCFLFIPLSATNPKECVKEQTCTINFVSIIYINLGGKIKYILLNQKLRTIELKESSNGLFINKFQLGDYAIRVLNLNKQNL